MGVIPGMSHQIFHDVEKLMRTKLAHMREAGLRRSLAR